MKTFRKAKPSDDLLQIPSSRESGSLNGVSGNIANGRENGRSRVIPMADLQIKGKLTIHPLKGGQSEYVEL